MEINVTTGSPYKVHITDNSKFNQILTSVVGENDVNDIIIISDQGLPSKYRDIRIENTTIRHIIAPSSGEDLKQFNYVHDMCATLLEMGITRKTCLIALGGGTVGDFVGFIASITLRGIRFIQIPTTLLAMVDSSVGGKTGINLGSRKNMVGAFYQPIAVVCNTSFLASLPSSEILNGYAEILKYGFIADQAFYTRLTATTDIGQSDFLKEAIQRSCQIKADVVSRDEFESSGVRETLNFGHTFGHGVEKLSHFYVPHGQAVAIGMVLACYTSNALGLCEINVNNVVEYYKSINMPYFYECDPVHLIKAMSDDKKNTDQGEISLIDAAGEEHFVRSQINLILLDRIGNAVQHKISSQNLLDILYAFYNDWN